MMDDYYSLLGIPFNATSMEVRNAYFLLAQTLHPDANPNPAAKDQFLLVQNAYEVLSDPKKRTAYDLALPGYLKNKPAITFSAKYSRTALSCMSEPQLTYVLLDLVCTADIQKNSLPPCHICLVLDRSTSMAGDRMDTVKSSAMNLLQQLRPQDILSVVAFSDRAEVLIPPTRASSLSKSDFRISLIQTGGGTEILQGLSSGVEQLRQTNNIYLRHLFLLTDGYTYGDDEGCLRLAQESAEEGISISVLGIGHEWNDILMDRIASLSGGESMYVSDPKEINNYLMQKLTDLGAVYARGLKLQFEASPGVELRYAFRLLPGVNNLPVSNSILLGDLQFRKSISVLLEFRIPPQPLEKDRITLAKGQILMDLASTKMVKSGILFDLHCPVRIDIVGDAPPPVIVEAMAKLTLYRMQERVRLEVEEGEIEKATKHLHYLATHLLSQGDRELAHSVLIEAEHVQQSRRLSGEGEKRIKYGTRALLLPPGAEL